VGPDPGAGHRVWWPARPKTTQTTKGDRLRHDNVRVFGSVARGDQRYDSDIDFLVDFEPGRSLFDLTGLWLDLETVLGCKVDVVSSRGLKPRLASEVMRDAVSL